MKFNEINIRDPFVLPFEGKYYMYGTRGSTTFGYATGFDVFVSEDLENWSEGHSIFEASPAFWADRNFWATDEVYIYNHDGIWRLRPKSPELLIVVDIKYIHELQHALRLLGVYDNIEYSEE